ncbi:MAG: flavodoxin domain-containing protein, partial [Hyphomicrobiaceae bacterium]
PSDLLDLTAGAPVPDIEFVSSVIVAGSIHRGRTDQALSRFLMCYAPRLARLPSAYVSVSLSAASPNSDARHAVDEIARHMLHEVGWHPDFMEHVAGAVEPQSLGLLERCAVHAVTRHRGIDVADDGRTELTDWDAVDAFVDRFAARLPKPRNGATAPAS